MNTLKFTKKSELSTEQHNQEVHKDKEIKIFDKKVNIYIPNNLSLFITNVCNSKCFFCINSNYTNQDKSDSFYYKSLKETLNELSPSEFEITITGGEPTIKIERFVKTLKMCYDYGFRFRTISTNGLNLLKKYKGKEVCEYMVENGAVHNISISRMDINNNKEIMGIDSITDNDIEKLANFFNNHDAEMRISCNLINGYVDSMDKILEFVDYYHNLGVPTVMFRELVGVKSSPKMIDTFKPNKEFKLIDYIVAEVYDVEVYEYKDYIVKHYKQKKNNNKTSVKNTSFRNGILREDFNGNIIKNFKEKLI